MDNRCFGVVCIPENDNVRLDVRQWVCFVVVQNFESTNVVKQM